MGKWKLEQVTSMGGGKAYELRWDGVIAMLLPRGCVQMGWEGGDLKRFLWILNAHDELVAACKEGLRVLNTQHLGDHSVLGKMKAAIAAAKGGAS